MNPSPPPESQDDLLVAAPTTASASLLDTGPDAEVDTDARHLVFLIADKEYACSVDQFVRVVRRPEVEVFATAEEPMPWWGGFVVDEGRAVPLVQLRTLWGLEPLTEEMARSHQAVLLFESRGDPWAFLLDHCRGVYRVSFSDQTDLRLSPALTGEEGSGFTAVLAWQGRLLVTLNLEKVLKERIRQQCTELLKTRYQPLVQELHHQQLRDQEMALADLPSVEGYLELARQYTEAGLHKEAARIIRIAEQVESGCLPGTSAESNTEFFGRLKPGMLPEVLQVLSRTSRTGELRLDIDGQMFRIYFREGSVINATGPNEPPGLASFVVALQAQHGTYRFTHRAPLGVPRLIYKRTESLLLEASQMIDELNREVSGL